MNKSILLFGTILAFTAGSIFLVSCGSEKHHDEDSTEHHDADADHEHDTSEATYACSMHPEITGEKGDKCSICKMDLTLVEAVEEGNEHQQ